MPVGPVTSEPRARGVGRTRGAETVTGSTRRTKVVGPPRSTSGVAAAPVPRQPKVVRYRPPWHRVVGGIELVVGVLLYIVSNYGAGFGYHPLPGPPILYLSAGGTLAFYSTFWFGVWDRPK